MEPQTQNYYGYQQPRRRISGPALYIALGVALLLGLVFFMISRGPKGPETELVTYAGQHSELARVSTKVLETAGTDAETANLASGIRIAALNNQKALTNLLASELGRGLEKEELETFTKTSYDDRLTTASQTNRTAEEYRAIASEILTELKSGLAATFQSTGDAEIKAGLDEIYLSNNVLLEAL